MNTKLAAFAVSAGLLFSSRSAYLPNPVLTPGAVLAVDAATVCARGYAGHARAVSAADKAAVLAAYHVTEHRTGEYEIDHLIALEIGGSNDRTNLWPEPASPVPGFHEKDKVENAAHAAVCSGKITLEDAQRGMAADWYALGQRLAR